MGQRIKGFIVVWLLFFSAGVKGQQKMFTLSKVNLLEPAAYIYYQPFVPKFSKAKIVRAVDCMSSPQFILLNPVPASYSSSSLGFFCQKELQFEKVIAVPIRFRLGSLAYVNWMEQKPNALNWGY